MRGAAAAPLFFPSSGRRPRIGASPSYSRAVQRRPEGEFEAQWWFQHTTQGDAAVLPCLIRSAADAHPTLPWRLRPRRTLLVPGCISPCFSGCSVTTLRCGAACRRRSRRPTPSWGSSAWTSSSTRFGCSGPGPSSTPSWGLPSCSLLDLLFYPPIFCCRSSFLRPNSRQNLSLG
ncbi:hypothetical protein ACQJBY_070173 [Aegilops geniculata]